MKYITTLILILTSITIFGQNKHIGIGYRDNGIGIGNTKNHNGLRLNLWDSNVESINGISASLNSTSKTANGLKISLLTANDSILNGISIAGLAAIGTKFNGFAIAVLGIGPESKFNGVGISGLGLASDTLNGFFFSAIGSTMWNTTNIKLINGFSAGVVGANTEKLNGMAMGFVNNIDRLVGVSLAMGVNNSDSVFGAQIAIHNTTKELHGIQIGLWNIAENNRLLKKAPIINIHLNKKASK